MSHVVYECGGLHDTRSARLARAEGMGPTGDHAADEVYDGVGATYDLYRQAYQRDSIDDHGMTLNGYVHFSQNHDNAFGMVKR